MWDNPANPLVIVGLLLFVLLAQYLLYRRKTIHMHSLLYQAKREVQDVAAIPRNDPNPLIQMASDGRILFVNLAAARIFEGIETYQTSHSILQGVDRFFKDDNADGRREVVYKDKVYFQIFRPFETNFGRVITIYHFDMTLQKERERELAKAQAKEIRLRQEAEKARQARGDFLANMSHELRTPMNGIIGLSELLLDAPMADEHKDMMTAVHGSARGLLFLLNDILDFSKIEAGELTVETIPFDVRAIAGQAESLHRAVAAEKGLSFKMHVDDTIPKVIMGDPIRLMQIIHNLVNNAVKFTNEGGVSVSIQSINGFADSDALDLRIDVRDTGIGIPGDKQKSIFNKFQQADTSTARQFGGTGLGLSITRDLVKLMQGRIFVESETGHGSCFTVQIPSRVVHETVHINAADETAPLINPHVRLMVVDDHPVNRLLMRKILHKMGILDFHEAVTGPEAIDLYGRHKYDVILMDCQMPDMDGFTAAAQIRNIAVDHDPVIIAVTADAMRGAADKCKEAGMDDYLSKPVDIGRLQSTLARWAPHANGDVLRSPEKTNVPDNTPIFDWSYLQDLTDNDADAINQIIGIFRHGLANDMGDLVAAYDVQDYGAWTEIAHKLYGGASNIRACELANLCNKGQYLISENYDEVDLLHGQISAAYGRLKEILDNPQNQAQ